MNIIETSYGMSFELRSYNKLHQTTKQSPIDQRDKSTGINQTN